MRQGRAVESEEDKTDTLVETPDRRRSLRVPTRGFRPSAGEGDGEHVGLEVQSPTDSDGAVGRVYVVTGTTCRTKTRRRGSRGLRLRRSSPQRPTSRPRRPGWTLVVHIDVPDTVF